MKKTCLWTALALGSTLAAAQPITLRMSTHIDIGVQISRYDYSQPGFMGTEGKKLGLSLGATAAMEEFFVTGNIRRGFGEVNYSSSISGTKQNNPDRLMEVRGLVGRDLEFDDFVVAPHIGFGYRTLDNDLRGLTSANALGYRRESEYKYLALGASHRFKLDEEARIVTMLEYDHLLSGKQKSYISDASPVFGAAYGAAAVVRQKKGMGLRASVDYEMEKWSIGAFYGYWKIDQSEVTTLGSGLTAASFVEPENTTREFGVTAKYKF